MVKLRMAIQKKGRLHDKSLSLLEKSGVLFDWHKDRLMVNSNSFPLEAMLVRDDDICEYVQRNIAQLGIVGLNVLEEERLSGQNTDALEIVKSLGFGKCRLSICVPKELSYTDISFLNGSSIATSYPNLTKNYLIQNGIEANVIKISGSVEISPKIGVADFICDLVSTGATLAANGLKECKTILNSECVLIKNNQITSSEDTETVDRLLKRMDGVLKAENSKYIMMNAPKEKVEQIVNLIPGLETPSIIPIGKNNELVAIHAVASEDIFWETMEEIKKCGASSILVVPIEKIIN